MHRFRPPIVVLLTAALLWGAAGSARAEHFDGNGATGAFDPTLTATPGGTVVNRTGNLTLRLNAGDHEDPVVKMIVRVQEWQFGFTSITPGTPAAGWPVSSPTTRCESVMDGLYDSPDNTGGPTQPDTSKRTNARIVRAEKIGTMQLDAHADGFSRPGIPLTFAGDVAFSSYNTTTQTAEMCALLILNDPRVTSIADTGPNTSGCNPQPPANQRKRCDDVEGVTELVAAFQMSRKTLEDGRSVWEVPADLVDLVQNSTLQSLQASGLRLETVLFGRSVGNYNAGGAADFARLPQVSGTKAIETLLWTCPQQDVPNPNDGNKTYWGQCLSRFGPPQWWNKGPEAFRDNPAPSRVLSQTVTVGLPAPAITAPASGARVKTTDVAVDGTADPNASVHVYGNGGVLLGDATANGSGAWSGTFFLPEGDYSVTAKTFDANTPDGGPVSNTRSFIVDVPPAPPAITSPGEAEDVGLGTVPVSGSAQPGSTVKVYEGATQLGSATTSAGGTWSTNVTLATKGPRTLVATSTDLGGESAPSAPRAFHVTTAVPVIAFPAQNGQYNTADLTITGTAEPGATVSVSEDGSPIGTALADAVTGAWSIPATFTEAPHTIAAVATALDGLVSPPAVRSFDVDFTAPDVPVVTAPAEGSLVSTRFVKVLGTAEPLSTVVVSENGTELGRAPASVSGAFTVQTLLAEGSRTITVVAIDRAGNQSAPSDGRTFIVRDPLKILKPAEGSVNPSAVQISVTTDPGATRLRLYDDGVQVFQATPAGGKWQGPVTFTTGSHRLTARTIVNGELGPPTDVRTFTVDGTKPVLSMTTPSPVALGSMALSGSATDNAAFDSGVARIEIRYRHLLSGAEAVQTATCVGCTSGSVSWTAIPRDAWKEGGTYEATITAYDAVGNASASQRVFVVG